MVRQANEQILGMDAFVLPDVKQPRGFIGLAAGKVVTADQLRELLPSFRLPLEKGGTSKPFPFVRPVGARIDRSSRHSPDDLPLVIVVGINPGDGSEQNRAMASMGVYSNVSIRPRLDEAFSFALSSIPAGHRHDYFPHPDKYHLVTVYLFPWLTEKAWQDMKLTPLEESLLIYGIGYKDPLVALKTLLKLLVDAKLAADWIVFHGSGPLIPAAAAIYAQQRHSTEPDVLICDDLNGTGPIRDCVVFGRPVFERHHTEEMNVDE